MCVVVFVFASKEVFSVGSFRKHLGVHLLLSMLSIETVGFSCIALPIFIEDIASLRQLGVFSAKHDGVS